MVGTKAQYTREELVQYMRAKILEYVPDLLAKNMVDQHVGILKISTHLSDFSQIIQAKLTSYFEEFGLTLDNFSFTNINAPDEDLAAINEMKIRRKQKFLEAEGNAQQMDIESEARMRMRQREGYTYQQ
ncbi:MAG: SPFH domain-containing protein, partial [Lachnospiraceae bacterium]|nr:SPFH domain-containing protein [Lachnospiraceae bacterium]